jgi:galactose oxidase
MFQFFITSTLLAATVTAFTLPYSPPPADVLDAEGFPAQPFPLLASNPNGGAPDRTNWVYTADSAQDGHPITLAKDGDSSTYFHSMYTPTLHYLPHTITIDTLTTQYIDGITYRPRQDGSPNGNIGQHKIYVSTDGVNYGSPVAFGTWYDDQTEKSAMWETTPARYVQLA